MNARKCPTCKKCFIDTGYYENCPHCKEPMNNNLDIFKDTPFGDIFGLNDKENI